MVSRLDCSVTFPIAVADSTVAIYAFGMPKLELLVTHFVDGLSAAIEAEFQRLVQYGLYPCYLAVHGSLGARRFVAIEGQPKYLTVYDFEDVRVSESDAWTRARASNPWTRGVQPNCGMTRSRQGSISVSIRIAQDFLIWCLPLLACRPSCDDREGAPQRLLTRSTA